MTSFESQPTQKFPQEKGKKLFEKMHADLRGEVTGEAQVNEDGGIILDDGIEIIPSRVEKDLEEINKPMEQTSEEVPENNFQTGAGAMDDWQKKQEAKEEERFEQANN